MEWGSQRSAAAWMRNGVQSNKIIIIPGQNPFMTTKSNGKQCIDNTHLTLYQRGRATVALGYSSSYMTEHIWKRDSMNLTFSPYCFLCEVDVTSSLLFHWSAKMSENEYPLRSPLFPEFTSESRPIHSERCHKMRTWLPGDLQLTPTSRPHGFVPKGNSDERFQRNVIPTYGT